MFFVFTAPRNYFSIVPKLLFQCSVITASNTLGSADTQQPALKNLSNRVYSKSKYTVLWEETQNCMFSYNNTINHAPLNMVNASKSLI